MKIISCYHLPFGASVVGIGRGVHSTEPFWYTDFYFLFTLLRCICLHGVKFVGWTKDERASESGTAAVLGSEKYSANPGRVQEPATRNQVGRLLSVLQFLSILLLHRLVIVDYMHTSLTGIHCTGKH